jgi:hypothetical protein
MENIIKGLSNINREFVESFSFSTLSLNRDDVCDVVIDGRRYIKTGRRQAVTLVGHKYRTETGYILTVGLAVQHPCDSVFDKSAALELASQRAYEAPVAAMNVDKHYSGSMFNRFAIQYVSNMKLQFVKTRKEIEKMYDGKVPEKFARTTRIRAGHDTEKAITPPDRYKTFLNLLKEKINQNGR